MPETRQCAEPRAPPGQSVPWNRGCHRLLVEGIAVQVRHADGTVRSETVRLIDFETRPATTGSR